MHLAPMTDYETARQQARVDIPEYYNFGFDLVDEFAKDPDHLAFISLDAGGAETGRHSFAGPARRQQPLCQRAAVAGCQDR
ncbi:MAG: hypothetical protein R3E68_18705 [Burkholderiaceae bacterium]